MKNHTQITKQWPLKNGSSKRVTINNIVKKIKKRNKL